jgi:hypothetical protein
VAQVLALIWSGDLPAINVSTKPGGRPLWRISEAGLQQFIERRRHVAAPKVTARTRRPKQKTKQYF